MYGCMPKRSNKNTTNGVNLMINHSFLINVKELMHTLLPRPKKKNSLDDDRAESIDQLKIISITVRDCDYYDKKRFKENNPY